LPLETATFISDLNSSNPAHTDGLSQADSHMRLTKAALKATFPNITGAVTLTQAQLNALTTALVDGTSLLPAFSFASEPTLGFYKTGPAVMSVTGGVLRGQGACPAGAVMDFATGGAAPAGWLPCDGTTLSTTTYADLFAAIGYTWGGSGATFLLPNFLNRFRRHRNVGSLAGAVGTTQSPVNLAHTHGVVGGTAGADTDHTHAFSGTTGVDSPDHTHTYIQRTGSNVGGGGSFGPVDTGTASQTSGASARHTHAFGGATGTMSAQHAHAINLTSGASGDALEARPYSATVLTCIKI